MCSSFSEYTRCHRCSKLWDFDYHTIHCRSKRCGLPKPEVIPPLVNNEPACLACKTAARAHITKWLEQRRLRPLLWNGTNNSWDSIWGAPN